MGMVGCFAAVDPKSQQRLRENPEEIEDYLYPDDGESEPPNYVDVDKAWHGIHYLLTGVPDGGQGTLALAVLGGSEVGGDVGYGPARFLSPAQVKEVAAALEALAESDVRSRFRPKEMEAADIYPEVIWVRDGEEALDYVIENFRTLVDFYKQAAARGDGAIAWLS